MNTLLDGLINSDSDEYYSSRAFDMDFSEYFLPTGTEDQAKLRTHAQRAVEWMGHIADDPVYDAEHSAPVAMEIYDPLQHMVIVEQRLGGCIPKPLASSSARSITSSRV